MLGVEAAGAAGRLGGGTEQLRRRGCPARLPPPTHPSHGELACGASGTGRVNASAAVKCRPASSGEGPCRVQPLAAHARCSGMPMALCACEVTQVGHGGAVNRQRKRKGRAGGGAAAGAAAAAPCNTTGPARAASACRLGGASSTQPPAFHRRPASTHLRGRGAGRLKRAAPCRLGASRWLTRCYLSGGGLQAAAAQLMGQGRACPKAAACLAAADGGQGYA